MHERSPSHAKRQRKYRARQRRGDVVVTITLTPEEIAKLHWPLQCLDLDRLEDRSAIANALHLMLGSIEEEE
jgi:hypothetical protein